jgi:hypothetical protein
MNNPQNNGQMQVPRNVILNGGEKTNTPKVFKPMTKYNKNNPVYKTPEYLNYANKQQYNTSKPFKSYGNNNYSKYKQDNESGFVFNNQNLPNLNPYTLSQNNRNMANNYQIPFNDGLSVPNNSPAESFINSQGAETPKIPFLKQNVEPNINYEAKASLYIGEEKRQFDSRGMSILPNKPFSKKLKPVKVKGGKKIKVEKPKPIEKYPNKGNPWEKAEEDEIKGELAEGKTILEISEKHQRSEKSIEKHIYKMAVAFLDNEPEKDKDELCAEYKINITKLKEILIKIEKASNKKVKAAAKHLQKRTEVERLIESVKELNDLIGKMTIEMNVFKDENNIMQNLIKEIHEKIMI